MGRILVIGEPGNQIIEALAPIDGEIVIDKPGKGAFYATGLHELLQQRGITHLLFGGVTTEVCVQTSMREANDRGYDSLLLEDCTESYFPAFKAATLDMMRAQGAIVGWTAPSAALLEASASRRRAAVQRLEQCGARRGPADDAALGAHHVERGRLECREVAFGAVLQQQAVVAAVVGLAHAGLHADLGGHAAEHQVGDAALLQQFVQAGGVERALAGLVDDDLAVDGGKRFDDLVAGFADHEDAAHGAFVADAQRGVAAV